MERLTFYIAAHLLLAAALAGSAAFRIVRGRGGLVEWGNDGIWIGLVFITVLTAAMRFMPPDGP